MITTAKMKSLKKKYMRKKRKRRGEALSDRHTALQAINITSKEKIPKTLPSQNEIQKLFAQINQQRNHSKIL